MLVDGGYIEGGVYHYYMTDHLGNNRVVVNASSMVTQRNHNYPFGTAFAENTVDEQKQQPYKYNGKELHQMHGLNLYDYSARYYESAVGRFTTVDMLAEKYIDSNGGDFIRMTMEMSNIGFLMGLIIKRLQKRKIILYLIF